MPAGKSKKSHQQIAKDLHGYLAKSFPGIEVEVGHSERWDRTCFTFRWPGFDDLLLEERFPKLARRIPPDYFEKHCQGVVWLELGSSETVEEFLAQPRSEDIDPRIDQIWKRLRELQFFPALEDELVRIPPAQCPDDLSISKRVLAAKKATADETRDACLAFIRSQAYSDWEVLKKVRHIAEKTKGKK